MASFAIILVMCSALCSIGGIESSPFPPPPTPPRRYGPPEFVNMKPRLRDWEPATPPKRPGLGIAEEPMDPDWNREPMDPDWNLIPVLDSNLNTAEEPIPVPGTAEGPPGTNPIPVLDTTVGEEPTEPIPVPDTIVGEEPTTPIPVPDTIVGEEPTTPIPVPGTTVGEEPALPNSDVYTPPKKPGLQDLHVFPVPITGGGPSAYP